MSARMLLLVLVFVIFATSMTDCGGGGRFAHEYGYFWKYGRKGQYPYRFQMIPALAGTLNPPTHSEWSEWATHGHCSVTCGTGTQKWARECHHQGETGCIGLRLMTKLCQEPGCVTWSEWSAWTQCAAACGTRGRRHRNRTCKATYCPGLPQQHQPCPYVACKTKK